MNSKKFLLGSFTAGALLFSMPSWSEGADHDIFEDDESTSDSSFSLRPVIEYDISTGGEFSTGGGNAGTFELESGVGFGVDASIPIDDNFRAEVNFRYRESGISDITYSKAMNPETEKNLTKTELKGINKDIEIDGTVTQLSLGGSVYYDIDTGEKAFRPYIGAGAHYKYVMLNEVEVQAGTLNAKYDDAAGGFGLSASVGVNYAVSDSADLHLGYRYSHDFGYDLEGTSVKGDGDDAEEVDTELSVENVGSHAIMAGIAIKF